MAKRSDPRNRGYAIGAIILGVVIFAALMLLLQLNWYIDWLIAWSISLFLLYGIDKTQAKLNNWRVPELELHVLALIGGFIGGWLGVFIFRHKTKKPIFKVVLAISTLIGIVLFYFFVLQR